MRYSKAFIPTLKEVPKDATSPSHKLLLRGGYVRMIGAGIYEMLPMGLRVLHKVSNIVRSEMNRSGAQEVLMPALLPGEYFKETGRWDSFGDALIRLQDRRGKDYNLGPTHEEIITDMVRRDIRSYKNLPINLYQIQMKFRDEPRPRAGLLRCREFLMKDAYSFDVDEAAAQKSYEEMREAYHTIFKRLGLDYRIVQADSGAMGGSTSAEFQVLVTTGEDAIVACGSCEYAANVEVAEAKLPEASTAPEKSTTEVDKVSTPGVGTIEDVVRFLGENGHAEGLTAQGLIKSLVYVADKETVLALVRGDHEVNEIRLARTLGADDLRLASDSEVEKATGAKVGFAGPVGFSGRIVADHAVAAMVDAVAGANETDHHVVGVNCGRDFEADLVHLRQVTDGDACPRCGERLGAYRGIEGGHIFILGTHYSAKMGATFLDENGKKKNIVMGCYGIGVSRLMASAIEQHHDDNGIVWPMPIAPYQVILTPIGKDADADAAASKLYDELRELGVDALLDDRPLRPGPKFKDADLLGIPIRVTIGKRGLEGGEFEVKRRDEKDAVMVPIADVADRVRDLVVELGGTLGTFA